MIDKYNFKLAVVQSFKYLCSILNDENGIQEDIDRRQGNRCFYALKLLFRTTPVTKPLSDPSLRMLTRHGP